MSVPSSPEPPVVAPPGAAPGPTADAGYRDGPPTEGGRAGRGWWDANAQEYLHEHGTFLGAADFCWCPEGLRERDAGLLGDGAGRGGREVGGGAAPGGGGGVTQGAEVVATDVSGGMLAAGAALDRATGVRVPAVQADARRLPFADATFDVAFTSFGAIPFVPDVAAVHREVARVLRPGGTWTFSVTHPTRWAFPDDPSERGLTANRSYFDRRPYVETDAAGRVVYAEYHRTLGDHVREVVAAGLELRDVVEPEWPADNTEVWGGWGPVRGAYLPGTAIFRTRLPG